MQATTNYGLQKPDPNSDNVDITVINGNMDAIDAQIKTLSNNIPNVPTKVSQLTNDEGFITLNALPSSLPASGGNAATVNNHTASAAPSTNEKTDLIGMVNELFSNANNGKSSVASAIGSPSTATETFTQLSSDINTQKSSLATNLTNKGVSALASEALSSLVSKVSSIARGQGTAVESQVLYGVPFSNSDGTLRYGSMPENGALGATLTNQGQSYTISSGHTNGGTVTANIANLIASNIISGTTVGGIVGSAVACAKGSTTSASGTSSFNKASSGTVALPYLTVSGLNLPSVPSVILVYSNYDIIVYTSGYHNGDIIAEKVLSSDLSSYTSDTFNYLTNTPPISITASGFTLPVYYSSLAYSWVAIV